MTRSMAQVARVDTQPTTSATTAAILADVRAAMTELKCVGSERLVRMGISMMQLHVLHLLEWHGELTMSRLADVLDVSVSAATGLIDRIEERGFVERIRVPTDRRIVLVRITDPGRQLLDDVEVLRTEIMLRVLEQLDPEQLERIAGAMADLRAALASTPTQDGPSHHLHVQGRE